MENTEIMNYEEIENTEEIVETEKDNSTKAIIGAGVAGLVLGVLAHKYGKPIVNKVKAKFSKKNETEEDEIIEADFTETVDEN